ncbi:hypothetical protein BDY21DRAFT_345364 [Lineolata rhizophorae]|uniref:Uncharacterized protein n=1 Tax=Lineolata rhizophorae TaxID=578093 RepID=A0A6A6P0D5_9PEZI|nr:hypothetical protein BDY21DRAFT_345364 [Lineolata rhizophorae]
MWVRSGVGCFRCWCVIQYWCLFCGAQAFGRSFFCFQALHCICRSGVCPIVTIRHRRAQLPLIFWLVCHPYCHVARAVAFPCCI